MKAGWVLGAATLVSVLALSGTAARAQDDTKAELEKYKQRTEALEKKVEQIEVMEAQKGGTTEEQIRKAAEKLTQEKMGPSDFRVFWKDGLQFQTADQAFTLHIGGRLHVDSAWIDNTGDLKTYKIPTTGKGLTAQEDGAEIRRARLQMDGTIYQNTFFKVEMDFGSSTSGSTHDDVQIRDMFIGFKDVIPFATVQVGHFLEPFSFEDLLSDNYLTFMERASPNAFSPDRQLGIQLSNAVLDQRATWAAAMFRTENQPWNKSNDQAFSQADGGYNFAARVTALPWYQDDKDETYGLLHVGAAGVLGSPTAAGTLDFSARPEMHLSSTFVDTGVIANSKHFAVYEGEVAGAVGPFSVVSEVTQAVVSRTGMTEATFRGGYVEASYFLTGEHRPYKKTAGLFDRVRPDQNFGATKDGQRGWGAWQVAARYSYLDLTDHDIRGGRMGDVTLGVNWYLNPNVRIMLNYVYSDLLNNVQPGKPTVEGGDANMLGVRFQVDF